MINDFFAPELKDNDMDDLYCRQDGARCHGANETVKLLKENFGERVILHGGPVA